MRRTAASATATTAIAATIIALAHSRAGIVASAFFTATDPTTTTTSVATALDPTFVPPNVAEAGITEPACLDAASKMRRVLVPVTRDIHETERVAVSYAHWPPCGEKEKRGAAAKAPSVVLIHGFDSSCLEYRRLGGELAEAGIDTYAVDLLGWGYTQLDDGVKSFSAGAKVETLQGWLSTVLESKPFVIAGASLGGAAAIEIAAAAKSNSKFGCQGLILLDAQGFVDGIGPMAALPKPLARLGVEVLKSVPLRSSANQMSYFDTETYATDEAVTVGRLHCLRDGWSDAMVSFMKSGGFSPSNKVPDVAIPALVIWGRQDGILDGEDFANRFLETLPDAQLRWMEECGHVPHLEQPVPTAIAISEFVRTVASTSAEEAGTPTFDLSDWLGRRVGSTEQEKETGSKKEEDSLVLLAGAGATALAAAAGVAAVDFLPLH